MVDSGENGFSLLEQLRNKVKDLPQTPGIYLMKNSLGKIIYVGKAKNLRVRVRSYFQENQGEMTIKTRYLVSHIQNFDYLLCKTEVEAFLLEASLIKKHRPKYNIRLKDDKAYPYIRISWADEYPRLYLSRKVIRDGSIYFGPFTKGSAVFETIKFLNRTFKIRDCTDSVFKTRKRSCMTHQIGRCTAPCVQLVTAKDYREEVEGAKYFLQGQNKRVISNLEKRMRLAADEERFEAAAKLRDSMRAVQSVLEKQTVINASSEKDQDIIGIYGDDRGTIISTLHVRTGRVIGLRSHFFPLLDMKDPGEDHRDWLVDFINQYYNENFIPDEILLPLDIGGDLTKLLEAVLMSLGGTEASKVLVRFPTDEKGRELLNLAQRNAEEQFQKYISKTEAKDRGLEEIQTKLGLGKKPRRIECYDISNFQGRETVASQVVFEDGAPSKDHYRRYKIKTVEGSNDFASMREVLMRRLSHEEYDRPDLIVVDGGKGQLAQAVRVLEELKMTDIPVVGLAKARTSSDFESADVIATEERFFLPGRSNPVVFKPNSEAYQILVGIRDEAHRFAVNYHRKLRENVSLESELDYVTGLGEKRKRDLLKHFGSVERIKAATAEEISEIPGFNRVLAERILLQLESSDQI